MSQRNSGYKRKPNDSYDTPPWVTKVLIKHIPPKVKRIWEPACGRGAMVRVLTAECPRATVIGTDISDKHNGDFLKIGVTAADAIITNPPYTHAREFIEHALELTNGYGFVAMLLRTDYDHAATRRHLFGEHPAFTSKIVLTKRIVWFKQKGITAAPSFNHAWFCWNWRKPHDRLPSILYEHDA